MDTIKIEKQLDTLPVINKDDDFFLKFKSMVDEEYAKSLVGKLIYFKWNHMFKENVTGKVLEYKDKQLLVYTNYTTMLEEDLQRADNLVNNKFIQNIPIEDITDVAEFTDYTKNSFNLVDENDLGNILELTNVQDKKIKAFVYDCDSIHLFFFVKINNNGDIVTEKRTYPVCLLKKLKRVD